MQSNTAEALEKKMKLLSIDNDFLKINSNKIVKEICDNETIIFSEKIKKINQNEWT
jgi:hypothetical protein